MTLRARLVFLVIAIAILLFGTSYTVISQHRQSLVRTVDEGLLKAAKEYSLVVKFSDLNVLPEQGVEIDSGTIFSTTSLPISDVLISIRYSDGRTWAATRGITDNGKPDLDSIDFSQITSPQLITLQGKNSNRIDRMFISPINTNSWLVASRNLQKTNSEIEELTFNVLVGVSIVAVLLLLLVLWVFRLGLRPIEIVTHAANSVISGARQEQVPRWSSGTEADQLSRAFNLMMNQRDRAEGTLRQFVSDASHELRTPLTAFEGLLELAQNEKQNPASLPDLLKRLKNESRRMRELVENLLLLANLDEGQELKKEIVNLGQLAFDCVSDIEILYSQRRFEIEVQETFDGVELNYTEMFNVLGDEMKIHQVVTGLIRNAIMHTPESADIKVKVYRDKNSVYLTVSDLGPGIDNHLKEVIFQRFVRGDQSRSRVGTGGGFGLGLPIARSIVENLGGTLTLDPLVEKGCAFTVQLPVLQSDASPQ